VRVGAPSAHSAKWRPLSLPPGDTFVGFGPCKTMQNRARKRLKDFQNFSNLDPRQSVELISPDVSRYSQARLEARIRCALRLRDSEEASGYLLRDSGSPKHWPISFDTSPVEFSCTDPSSPIKRLQTQTEFRDSYPFAGRASRGLFRQKSWSAAGFPSRSQVSGFRGLRKGCILEDELARTEGSHETALR
jgi:hypothetical protein